MNVWYINSMLGTLRLEEEDDALCGVQLCPDGVPDLEPDLLRSPPMRALRR